jgi:integral membrane protein (TIGR00529 family)
LPVKQQLLTNICGLIESQAILSWIITMIPHIAALLKMTLVFFIILLAIRRRFSLGSAFLLGAVALGLIFGAGPLNILKSILGSMIHPKTLSLALIVSLILVLSHSMEMAGQLQRLLDSFQGLIRSPRINMVVFPALIGLLPMPGGAIFSAPMVKTLGARLRLSDTQLSYINYWFRHIWEYWWPLYPGVLLTVTIANLNLWVFALFLIPLTPVAVCAGYWPLKAFRSVSRESSDHRANPNRPSLGPFLRELIPIIIAIGLGIGMGIILSVLTRSNPAVTPIAKEIGLVVALCVAIGWVWHRNRIRRSQRRALLKNRQLLRMIYMVLAILAFKGVLVQSRAVEAISQELLGLNIPLFLITVLLPFLVGSVVGITIVFVGTTMPILISLIQAFGEGHFILAYMMLALASGFAGVLLSPLHVCLLLSNEFFGTTLVAVYRYLWVPCLVLLGSSMAYFLMLHWLNGLTA